MTNTMFPFVILLMVTHIKYLWYLSKNLEHRLNKWMTYTFQKADYKKTLSHKGKAEPQIYTLTAIKTKIEITP